MVCHGLSSCGRLDCLRGFLGFAWAGVLGALTVKRAAVFLLLWLGGLIGLPHLPSQRARAMFSTFVPILDIALVFIVFKGDVHFY